MEVLRLSDINNHIESQKNIYKLGQISELLENIYIRRLEYRRKYLSNASNIDAPTALHVKGLFIKSYELLYHSNFFTTEYSFKEKFCGYD